MQGPKSGRGGSAYDTKKVRARTQKPAVRTSTSPTNSNDDSNDSNSTNKRRIAVCLSKPNNQSCCECSDPKPTWASLIVPPPASLLIIPSSQQRKQQFPTIGVLCCYQCAGLHRSLGTHICRVKSCHLDDCTYSSLVSWYANSVR